MVFGGGGYVFEGEGKEGRESPETDSFTLLDYINDAQSLIPVEIYHTFQRKFSLTGLPNAENTFASRSSSFQPLNLIILDQGGMNAEGF